MSKTSELPPTKRRYRRVALWLLPVVVALALVYATAGHGCRGTVSPKTAEFLHDHGISYSLDVRKEPRPLRIHRLMVDLEAPGIEVISVLGDDPGIKDRGAALLESPLSMARRSRAIALVNANPWWNIPDEHGVRPTTTIWKEGMPVEIMGLAVSKGVVRQAAFATYCALWFDNAGKVHVGNPNDLKDVREAVAGYRPLVVNGKDVHEQKPDLQPRTAIGLDASARWLCLVVVDGRQPDYSEGMSYAEMADYMLELGCTEAVSFDGGGSSIMILSDKKSTPHIANDPSTRWFGFSLPRPIPVALAVRLKQ